MKSPRQPAITLNRVFATRQDDERVVKALQLVVKASYESDSSSVKLPSSTSVGSVPGPQNLAGDNAKSTSLPEGDGGGTNLHTGEGTNLRSTPSVFSDVEDRSSTEVTK